MAVSTLRVLIDGDSDRVYRPGDKVTGRVAFIAEEQVHIESFRVIFAGSCVTRTSRPTNDSHARKDFEERIRFFTHERQVVPRSTLSPKKYSWTFEFTFPETTAQTYKRLSRGIHYLREPHPLPPSFQLKTSVPGGAAQVSYFLQARLVLSGSKGTKKVKQMLMYRPISHERLPREPNLTANVLYGHTWKPSSPISSRSPFSKVLRRPSASLPSIVPTIYYPEKIAPGQHIPLAISLLNTRDRANSAGASCTLEAITVTMSTYSTILCGSSLSGPEDVVSKHVPCIERTNISQPPLMFNKKRNLTTNFRLVNDAECVPSFKSYTVTRRYALGVVVVLKYGGQGFTVRHSAPLEILPRPPRSLSSSEEEEEGAEAEAEPLPVYSPREPSREFAPDYEAVVALSRTGSAATAQSLARWTTASSGASAGSSAASLASMGSGGSTPATAPSTPVSEVDEPAYVRRGVVAVAV
ncbi:hypothetical protein B5807_09765 [Epicoccum nigrum]|uniref:Arrestin-like N-terminal domain-containing protein n=1 Tax=Epicoccum nigrum TaxID=105696 RepID=A0A1Y2LPB4_EPING|nr:hypothetical protein B5807_09765 [Epicoccum nigrum]